MYLFNVTHLLSSCKEKEVEVGFPKVCNIDTKLIQLVYIVSRHISSPYNSMKSITNSFVSTPY